MDNDFIDRIDKAEAFEDGVMFCELYLLDSLVSGFSKDDLKNGALDMLNRRKDE